MNPKHYFSISVDIAASPEHIWNIMSDVENWHTWTASVRKIKRLDNGPFTLRSKVLIYQPKFPPALWRATSFEQGQGFTWVTSGPGVRVTAHHFIEPTPQGSRVTLSVRYSGL